jgi:hypothetical protein
MAGLQSVAPPGRCLLLPEEPGPLGQASVPVQAPGRVFTSEKDYLYPELGLKILVVKFFTTICFTGISSQ